MKKRTSFETKAAPFFCDLGRQEEKKNHHHDTRLQHEFSFPSALGGPGSHKASTHETEYSDGALSHHNTWKSKSNTHKEADLCLLLAKKQQIETDILPKKNGLKNGCHQAKEKVLLQELWKLDG